MWQFYLPLLGFTWLKPVCSHENFSQYVAGYLNMSEPIWQASQNKSKVAKAYEAITYSGNRHLLYSVIDIQHDYTIFIKCFLISAMHICMTHALWILNTFWMKLDSLFDWLTGVKNCFQHNFSYIVAAVAQLWIEPATKSKFSVIAEWQINVTKTFTWFLEGSLREKEKMLMTLRKKSFENNVEKEKWWEHFSFSG